ncbi:hypothetical protein, partial, partial [Absidia glauca]
MKIPDRWLLDSENLDNIIKKIYPGLSDASDPTFFAARAILTTKNEFVDRINTEATNRFPGDESIYTSNDCVIDGDDPDADSMNYPVEFLNGCNPSGVPPHSMVIKIGMPLIILRNLDVQNGLCNGTKVYALELWRYSIKVKTYIGGKEFLIPRIHFTSNEGDYPFTLRRRQLPVRPAFAMTIHKSQGQTISHVGVYLNQSVFTHGQLYVALSRATDPSCLFVAVPLSNSSSTSPVAKNVVF